MSELIEAQKDTINWEEIRDIDDLREWEEGLYDTSPTLDDVYSNKIADDLSDEEVMEAAFWKFFTRGLIMIVGPPGSGKNLLAIHMCYKMKKLFSKQIILDYKPREPFGLYIPFSIDFLIEQIDRVSEILEVAKGRPVQKGGWVSSRGKVLLHKAFMHLDEFKKYMPRETSNTNMSNAMNSLFTVWRHFDIMCLSSCTKERDIAEKGIKEITCKIYPSWIGKPKGTMARKLERTGGNIESEYWARYIIQLSRFVEAKGVTVNYGQPLVYYLDGGAPIEPGSKTRWIDLYNTQDLKAIRISKSFRKQRSY